MDAEIKETLEMALEILESDYCMIPDPPETTAQMQVWVCMERIRRHLRAEEVRS